MTIIRGTIDYDEIIEEIADLDSFRVISVKDGHLVEIEVDTDLSLIEIIEKLQK